MAPGSRPALAGRLAALSLALVLLGLVAGCGGEEPVWGPPPAEEPWRSEHAAFLPKAWQELAAELAALLPPAGVAPGIRAHLRTRSVEAVVPDPLERGVLWLATDGGAARFDTRTGEWRHWGRADGLASHDLEDLWIDPGDGAAWAVGFKGLSVLPRGAERWQAFVDGGYRMHRRFLSRVVPDPSDPEALVLLSDQLFRYHRGEDKWQWSGFEEPLLDLVTPPGTSRWVVVTEKGLWSFERGKTRRLLAADEAEAVIGAPEDGSYGIRLRSAALVGGGRIAVSTISDGIFLLGLDGSDLAYPAFNHQLVGDCTAPRLFRAGSRWLLHGGDGCWGEVSPDFEEMRPLAPLPVARLTALAADPEEPDVLWLGTAEGLLRFDLRGGEATWHRPAPRGPRIVEAPGSHAVDLVELDGKLWVAFADGPLGFLDLQGFGQEAGGGVPVWDSVPGLASLVELEPLADGRLLGYGGWEAVGEPGLWALDPETLAWSPFELPWDDLVPEPREMLEHEGVVWLLGPARHDGPLALAGLAEGVEHFLMLEAGTDADGAASLVADPLAPGVLWVSAGGDLLRIETGALTQEKVREGVLQVGSLGDGRLWILAGRQESVRLESFDPRTREAEPLGPAGRPVEDPLDPGRLWIRGETSLATWKSGETRDLPGLPPNLKIWRLLPAAGRLWIASTDGLFECCPGVGP